MNDFGEPFEVDGIWYNPNTAGKEQHQGLGKIKEDGCTAYGMDNHHWCLSGGEAAKYIGALDSFVSS